MSSPRRIGNTRFTRGAIVGIVVSVLAMACLVTFLLTEHKAFLATGLVLMVAGQVTLWVPLSRRTRLEEARRMKP